MRKLAPLSAAGLPDTPAVWRYLYMHANPRAWSPRYSAQDDAEAEPEPASPASRDRSLPLGGHAPWLARTEAEALAAQAPHHSVHSAGKRVTLERGGQHLSSLSREAIQQNLQVLERLVPSFAHSQSQLSCTQLVRLAEDPPGCFARLAGLKAALPRSSLSSMLGIRPELLLPEAFASVSAALAELTRLFPGVSVALVAERQPFWLLPDCAALLEEMLQERLLPEALRACLGKKEAAARAERILACAQGSAIQGTRAYQRQRRRIIESCARPLRPRPWEQDAIS